MNKEDINPLEDTESEAALAYAEERRENIRTFVRTNPDYYIRNFDKIGASSRFTPTFNLMAGLFGPIWFGARGLWSWALPFLILEALAFGEASLSAEVLPFPADEDPPLIAAFRAGLTFSQSMASPPMMHA